MSDIKIRTVTENDAEQLLEIYAPYVEKTAITFEYEVPSVEEFKSRIKRTLSDDEYLNGNSHGFHKHLGYRLVGRFTKCGFKFGKWYDMIWMVKHIGEHTGNPKKVKWFSE